MRNAIYGIVVAIAAAGYFGFTKFGGKFGFGKGGGGSGISAKLSGYIECMNRFSSRAFDSRSRYLSWADAEKGPAGARNAMGLYSLYDPKQCLEGIAGAKDIDPKNPELEAAGDAYGAALAKLVPLLDQANDYYEQKNFKDDKFAKGQELHPKLMAAWDEFSAADIKLRGQVSVLNRAERERSLAEREKTEGKNLMTLLDRASLEAQDLMDLGSVDDPSKIQVDAFTAQLDSYEKAVLAVDGYASSHANEQPTAFSFTLSALKDYLTASKELMRRARDKTPYSSSDKMNLGGSGEWMVNGSPGKMLKEYNDLVDAMNRL
jgi:hypothetical protein